MSALAFDFDQYGHLVPSAAAQPTARPAAKATLPAPQPQPQIPPQAPPVTVKREAHPAPQPFPLGGQPKPSDLVLDRSRDALLTAFGKATLTEANIAGTDHQPLSDAR